MLLPCFFTSGRVTWFPLLFVAIWEFNNTYRLNHLMGCFVKMNFFRLAFKSLHTPDSVFAYPFDGFPVRVSYLLPLVIFLGSINFFKGFSEKKTSYNERRRTRNDFLGKYT